MYVHTSRTRFAGLSVLFINFAMAAAFVSATSGCAGFGSRSTNDRARPSDAASEAAPEAAAAQPGTDDATPPQATESLTDGGDTRSRATVYEIPQPLAPEGQVEIQPLGIVDVRAKEKMETLPALRLRVSVRNVAGRDPWIVNAREQVLVLDSGQELNPDIMNAAGTSSGPRVEIAPGQSQDIDYFFILPPDFRQPTDASGFRLRWSLLAGAQVVSGVARLDRDVLALGRPVIYPFEPAAPAGTGQTPLPESDWWMDPGSDLPQGWWQAYR